MKTPTLPLCSVVSALLALAVAARGASGDEVTLTRSDGRIRVEVGGALFSEYVYTGASRPYCYPILAPDGTGLTRDFPMKDTPGEEHDHPWHRSLWFAHSMMNGVDFWNEGKGDVGNSPSDKGDTIQTAIVSTSESKPDGTVEVTLSDGSQRSSKLASPRFAAVHTRDNYVAPGGRIVCTDDRTIRFVADGDARFIDFEVTLHAPADGPLVMGDNKDGTMAMRLASWLCMAHKSQKSPGVGHIVTATGEADNAAWGKRADWCEYHAEHNGKVYGVAILESPTNFRHPTWWMARDYGLFGANPFGQHDYEKLADKHAGDATIPAGGSLTLKYRFYVHFGDEKAAHVADRYRDYTQQVWPEIPGV